MTCTCKSEAQSPFYSPHAPSSIYTWILILLFTKFAPFAINAEIGLKSFVNFFHRKKFRNFAYIKLL